MLIQAHLLERAERRKVICWRVIAGDRGRVAATTDFSKAGITTQENQIKAV